MQDLMLKEPATPALPFQSAGTHPHVLILPGLDNSGPGHWQTHWQTLLGYDRVDFGTWSLPRLHDWIPTLDRAIRECSRPLVLAAHSLGCLAAAWWASLYWTEAFREKVVGALLVAPPDVDSLEVDRRLRDFRPLPQRCLPFPSILIASRNDPHIGFERSAAIAEKWGSDFVDAGFLGHVNAESGIAEWPAGLRHLATLSGRCPDRLVMELGVRAVLA